MLQCMKGLPTVVYWKKMDITRYGRWLKKISFLGLYGFWEGLVWCKILPRGVGTICPYFWEVIFFAKIEKCQLFVYELILELFARSWSPNFPIQFSEICSSGCCWAQLAWIPLPPVLGLFSWDPISMTFYLFCIPLAWCFMSLANYHRHKQTIFRIQA